MRRWIVLATWLAICPAVWADDAVAPRTPADKFMRGLTNLITAPLEIPRHMRARTRGDNTFRGWTVGTANGLGYTVVRFAAGAYDVLTFPAPAPKDYAPVLEPEYIWSVEGNSRD